MRDRLSRRRPTGVSRIRFGLGRIGVAVAMLASAAIATGDLSAQTGPQTGPWESRYSTLDFGECPTVRLFELGGENACPGPAGWTAIYAESDLRQFIAVQGPNTPRTDSVGAGSPQFNRTGSTLEWRGRPAGSDWQPETLILRWFLEEWDGGRTPIDTQILRVFRLDRTATGGPALCPIGTVVVADNPDHNADARTMADAAVADGFRCPPTTRPEKPRTN